MGYEIHFAPLQGCTDRIFRNAFDRYFGGITTYYTPFIRVERGGFRNRDVRDIDPSCEQVPGLIPQILPGSPEEFRMLAGLLDRKGYRSVDINLGCPFPPIAGKRKGAGMLPFPALVKEVLTPVGEYAHIDFSVKMRLGWENADECLFLADVFNSLRLHHITIHARTGRQQYKGETDPAAFARFYARSRHPLFYNGDLTSVEEIRFMLEKFPLLRGVSVGRGLLSSPLMAKEFLENETFPEEYRTEHYFAFHQELFSAYSESLQGEVQLLNRMKSLWEYFLPDTDRKLRKQIKKATRINPYLDAVGKIFSSGK